MTDRTKTICPPIFDLGGIKIVQIGLNMFVQSFYIKKLAVSQIMKSEAAYLGL